MIVCLDSLTVSNTEPVNLIRAARSAGFDWVSLWAQPPSIHPLQLVTTAKAQTCLSALAETGIQVGPLEVFDLGSAEAVQGYRPALELGARLGAKTASAINVRNVDAAAVSAHLAQFTATAREYGLGVTLEPLHRFATATLAQARDIIRASSANVGIVVDAHHLVRVGGTAADLQALEPGLIRYIQVCDGPASVTPDEQRVEATFERLYPGEGAFPLVELLRDAPLDIPWGIEAPSRRRATKGESAEVQAKAAMEAVRRLVQAIKAQRA
jgi:sugar phosphate isomerase/epimerase